MKYILTLLKIIAIIIMAFTDGWSKLDVIAWQPLPQPYEPKGEES